MMKPHGLYLIIPLLLLSLSFPFHPYAQDTVATALYEEGLRKYILEDYIGAIEDFDGALKLKPDDSKIRKMYVNTLIKQGNREYEANNLELAKEYFLRAYKLSGEDRELRANLETIQLKIEEQRQEIARKEAKPEEREVRPQPAEFERVTTIPEQIEIQLPFDMEAFIQQQNEENKKLLEEMLATQRKERETLFQNIEEGRKMLNESFLAQREERQTLFHNLEKNRKILDESFKAQKEERETLYGNIEESRQLLDQSMQSQRDERSRLFNRMAENQKLLNESMRAQQEEREFFLKNIMEISRSQSEDRKLFSRTLMILVGGSIFIAIIIFFGFVILLRRRAGAPGQMIYHEPQPSLELKPQTLLEYTEKIDEEKYITDERYSDVVKAKRLRDLYQELQEGNTSWDVIQGYISELNQELKSEILNIVENKIKSGESAGPESAMEILLPFITDGERDIGKRSRTILKELTGEAAGEKLEELERLEDTTDPLGTGSLLQFARMSDAKTGRINHSVRVAEISFQISQVLKDPELDSDTVRKVALAHDIGYLELDDKILKKEGKLTQREFAIIKTHSRRGLNLFHHVELPQIFIDGIKYHHERMDGSGYPKGLKGEKIPKIARLLAVADFFDAVTSARPHRPALTIGSAIKMMEKLSGEIFDQKIFNILVDLYKDQMDDEI